MAPADAGQGGRRDAQSATLSFLRAAATHCRTGASSRPCCGSARPAAGRAGRPGGCCRRWPGNWRTLIGQDHARLYYILLAHLAGPISSGVALGPSLAAPALASSLVAENQGFAAALMVQRLGPGSAKCGSSQSIRGPSPGAAAPGGGAGTGVFSGAALPCGRTGLRTLGAVHMPCLCPGRPTPRPLLLPLQPRRPAPAKLTVRALYTTPSGLTCHTHLPPLLVTFADLFLPFPGPRGASWNC